ncbi:MAG: Putrescine transport system permease protein potI [candidate division TM6 bacterium GW2011_GWF2_38_10]|nr:MAG: Putrescine transport system permease protein potI [candidate division TM6 bacterium GW2011_GWF2_38_10]
MVGDKKYMSMIVQPIFVSVVYLFLYLPIIVMVLFSFNKSANPMKWGGFSLQWYTQMWNIPEMVAALKTSLIVAAASTLLSLIIGVCFVVAHKWWKSEVLFSFFYVNILLPDIVLAIGVLSIFTFSHIPLGYGSLIVGHTLIGLGFVIPIIRARFVELDPYLTEASLDLGATYFQTFRRVLIPLLMPSLVAAGLLAFTLSLDDFLIAFFCAGPKVQTLSVYVYSMVKAGVDPTINAISAVLLGVSGILILVLLSLNVIDQVLSQE